jgi:hypothetical protein
MTDQPAEFLTIPGADFIPAAFLAPRRLIAWGVAVIEAAVIAWEDAHDCWGEEEVSEG